MARPQVWSMYCGGESSSSVGTETERRRFETGCSSEAAAMADSRAGSAVETGLLTPYVGLIGVSSPSVSLSRSFKGSKG